MDWRLFADLADIVGSRRVSDSLPDTTPCTVADAISGLVEEYPALAERMYDESGELYEHINVLKNGQDITNLDGLETVVSDDDEIALFPPVSGG